jgi:amino-acid N-acetyltransferase
MIIRRATQRDAERVSELVNLGEREGQLLPRTLDAILNSIDDWLVAEEGAAIVGCGSLIEMGPALSEIRSLAVAPGYRRIGIGARIVEALIEEARARRIPMVFALTRAVPFFEKLGFLVTVKEDFPEKVWRDCLICPVHNACDEVAVARSVAGGRWAAEGQQIVSNTLDRIQLMAHLKS